MMGKRAIGILCVCLAAPAARAAVPSEFTVQGVLRDAAGALQSMPVTVVTNFYDDPLAGTKLNSGSYSASNVPTSNGLFSQTFTLTAGDVTALGAAAQVWMAVQIGSDSFARQKVTPELSALFAKRAESADALSAACSGWVGNTTGMFGATRPVSLVSNDASIGFNTYYNGGWRVATGGAGTAFMTVDNAGDFAIHTGNAPAVAGTAITETEKVRIRNVGMV